jgi:hypothetical protein
VSVETWMQLIVQIVMLFCCFSFESFVVQNWRFSA